MNTVSEIEKMLDSKHDFIWEKMELIRGAYSIHRVITSVLGDHIYNNRRAIIVSIFRRPEMRWGV